MKATPHLYTSRFGSGVVPALALGTLGLVGLVLVPAPAFAEISVAKAGDWEMFTDGRISGFMSYARGDSFPPISTTTVTNPDGTTSMTRTTPQGGGLDSNSANPIGPLVRIDPATGLPVIDPNTNAPIPIQGKIEMMRVRSGFSPNILGVGFRRPLTEWTSLTGYFQFWSDIETNARRKYLPMPVDVRVGYLRLDGHWGTLTVGRQLTLFSRGAAEIDFLYGHGYALGNPVNLNDYGPAAGHIGTGVLGPGFAAGVVYSTPSMAGLQLNFSIFDPVTLQGAYDRTKYARPEAEFTFDRSFGGRAKLHLFVNGAYQKVYRAGFPDSGTTPIADGTGTVVGSLDNSSAAYGAGYGGRVEVGPVHFGVAGHWGQGLGLYYALETSEAAYSPAPRSVLRKSDGYYAQLQLALAKFDVNAGAGISRMKPLAGIDNIRDTGGSAASIIKYQLGMSLAFVYHVSPSLHVDIDYFRAQFAWSDVPAAGNFPAYTGGKQNVNFINSGVTMVW